MQDEIYLMVNVIRIAGPMLSLVGVWVGAVGPLVLRLLTRCSSTAIGKLSFMICLCKRIFLDIHVFSQ